MHNLRLVHAQIRSTHLDGRFQCLPCFFRCRTMHVVPPPKKKSKHTQKNNTKKKPDQING
jgi:hypothetical protein